MDKLGVFWVRLVQYHLSQLRHSVPHVGRYGEVAELTYGPAVLQGPCTEARLRWVVYDLLRLEPFTQYLLHLCPAPQFGIPRLATTQSSKVYESVPRKATADHPMWQGMKAGATPQGVTLKIRTWEGRNARYEFQLTDGKKLMAREK